jgi:hypothetical protein
MNLASRSAAAFGVLALSTLGGACGSSASDASTDDGSDGSASVAPEGGSDAGSPSDAGTSSDATPSDATVSLDSGHGDGSTMDAASANDGSVDDHTCDAGSGCAGGCALGYHSCASGCCAFGTKPILDPGSLDSIESVSCAVAADGTIHVLYLDATDGLLVHAFGHGSALSVEGVASGPIAGGSIALDSTGEPVAIYEAINTLYNVWHIDAQRRVDGAWSPITSVVGGAPYNSLIAMATGIDATGNWSVIDSAQSSPTNTLEEQTFVGGDAGAWSSEALSYSPWSGFGFDSHATPYVLWMDTFGKFDVAQPQSGTWMSRVYATPPADTTDMNAVLDANGDPAFAVADASTVAHYAGGAWSTDTTPLPAQPGAPFLAVDASGNPVVAQWDGEYIQIARRTSSVWETGMIGPTPPSQYPAYSVALDPSAGDAPVVCWVVDPGDSVVCSTW